MNLLGSGSFVQWKDRRTRYSNESEYHQHTYRTVHVGRTRISDISQVDYYVEVNGCVLDPIPVVIIQLLNRKIAALECESETKSVKEQMLNHTMWVD
ncbi:MAG TPA: hypothetical protein DIS79_06475 [Bacteroidetes bacterium]|nr:hypothetical protein [Bacteroidota bacterium]HRK05130.1 hypothetical protein [Chlorobiota bacterium]